MAINRYRFYLGPLGLLQPLPPLPGGAKPEAPLRWSAAEHVSLSGRTTQDRIGKVRRSWGLEWEHLTEDQELHIQAAIRGQAGGGLRLMDPRKRNLAPNDTATGGGDTRSTRAFTKTGAGTIAYGAGGGPLDLLGITGGRIIWTGATNTGTLYGTEEKTPIITGSTYRVSAYIKSTTSFRFSAIPHDLLGVAGATITDATSNASTAGAWVRFSWLYTPAAGVSSAHFGITATGSGNIETTGWMYQIDQSLAAWSFGYGCPQVIISPGVGAGYWRTSRHRVSLVLREA